MGLDFSKPRGPDCACDATDAYKQMLHSVHVRYHGVHGGGDALGGACAACKYALGGDAADDANEFDANPKSRIIAELKNYESSLAATAKEETIRRIAHAMKRAGIAVDPEGDLDAVVEELQRQLPNPKNGKTFAASASAQEKVCRVIADVLNDEFSPGVHEPARKYIDTSMNAAEVCRAVAERAHSFSRGVNVEFLAVHVSIKNALRNIQMLEGVIDAAHKKLSARIAKHGDAQLTADLEDLLDLSARARAEQKRAVDVLKDILHVQIPESAKLLEIAMQEHSDLNATIKKLRLAPGTSQFGNTLASAISGLGTAAAVAARAHRALKAAGVSVRDFIESPSFKEFRAKLDARVESGAVPTKDLVAFLRAAEDLRHAFAERERDGFRAALERGDNVAEMLNLDVAGGADSDSDSESGSDSESDANSKLGGADDDEGSKTERERRMQRQQASSTLIIRDFAMRLARHYDDFLAAVKALGPLLGKEIPLTDHTDKLQEAVRAIQQDNPADKASTRVELAIMGRYADAGARKLKDTFIARLRIIQRACEELLGLEMYRPAAARFSKVLDAVSAIEKTIAFYSKTFEEGLGRGTGEAKDVSLVLPEIAKSSYSLQEAVTEFLYLYYVARVRSNLAKTSRELDTYGDKYEDLLDGAIKNRLSQLEWERYVYVEGLKKLVYPIAAPAAPVAVFPGTAANHYSINQTLPDDAARKKAIEHITEEYKVKSAFYRAIQALDLYMKEFTVAIAKNPDAIDDIKKMFDGAQVIARWFSEMTGDSICKAFEQSDSLNWANGAPVAASHRANVTDIGKHYYDKFGATVFNTDNVDVGMPGEGIKVGEPTFTESKKQIKGAYENFQALKNLVNAFARIGDKFGGQELHAKVFMSPAQIYKALLDYLKHSALSINRAGTETRKNTVYEAPALADNAVTIPAAGVAGPRFVEIPLPATMLGDAVLAPVPAQALYGAGPYQAFFSRVDGECDRFDNYAKERPLFATAVKAMAAKILTVVGVFDMFERTTPLYELTPVRTIIGGGDADVVPDAAVEPAAVELYYRMPLLAEFYRKLLQFDTSGAGGGNDPQIALIADFEGTFSGIIKFMFLKTQDRDGEYSESEVRTIVREVNAIHAHFVQRHAEGTTSAVLSAFVAEINRRYGIVKKSDYEAFAEANRRLHQLQDGTADPRQVETNYAILPGEDAVNDRPLPSTYIPKGWEAPNAADPFKDRPELNLRKTLVDFRKKLDSVFATKRDMFDTAGSALKIRQAQGEIERATTAAARFKVVSALIRGESTSVDSSVSLVFHETVVVGLNTLSAIETMLRTFHQELKFMDPMMIEGAIMDAFFRQNALAVVGGPGAITNHATLIAVMNAMRSIGAVPVRDPIASAAGTPLPSDNIADDLIMRNYMLGGGVGNLLGARSQINANLVAAATLNGNDICQGAVANPGNFLLAATIVANGPQNWTRQPSSFTDEFIPANDAATYAAMGGVGPAPGAISSQTLGALRVVARLLTNYPEIMYRFLEAMFAISNDGLVDVHVSKGGVRADFSKLQTLVEEIFADVKYHFEMLRPSISADIAKRFSDVDNKGSIGWIDTHLVDKYFRGREFQDPATARAQSREGIEDLISKVFKHLTRNTAVNFEALGDAGSLSDAAAGIGFWAWTKAAWDLLTPDARIFGYEWYGSTFARIGWYDALRADSGIGAAAPAGALADGADEFGGLIATGRPDRNSGIRKHPRINPASANGDTGIFNFYTSGDQTLQTTSSSLMFNFNRLVARYLLTLMDSAAGNKIYLNLVNAFANGVASGSITNPGAFAHPDITNTGGAARTFFNRGDPKANSILLASIAWALQRIRNDSNPSTNVADHLVTTLTDVPLYIKEAMRANLPSFVRLFDLIAKKCDFVKQVMQKTNALSNRPNARTLANAGPDALIWSGVDIDPGNVLYPGTLKATCLEKLDSPGQTAEEARALRVRFAAIFDAIAGGALALSGAASETLKELGDSPIYLQTGEGSIEQYTMRFGKAPLMPFSLALYMLRNNAAMDGSPIALTFPRHSIGTPNFKMMYGMRGILAPAGAAPLSYDQLPGVQTALAIYNGARSRSGRGVVDPARYLRFAQAAATAIRWITDARCYKGMLSAERTIREVVLVNPDVAYAPGGAAAAAFNVAAITRAAPLAGAAGGAAVERQYAYAQRNGITLGPAVNPRTAAYALGTDAQLENVLSIVESSDQEDSVNDIAKAIGAAANDDVSNRRHQLQVQNLVDMNIMPINVHAMMRGVPLANLYNYEYTFEQFACQMMGEQYKVLSDTATLANPKNTTQAFLQLLAAPYRTITPDYYGSDCTNAGSEGFVHRIFRGDNALGMGRPKFLSDQLFNKPLFGSVYQSRQDWDEGGPAVGIGKARGYAEFRNVKRLMGMVSDEMRPLYDEFIREVGNPAGLQISFGNAAGGISNGNLGANDTINAAADSIWSTEGQFAVLAAPAAAGTVRDPAQTGLQGKLAAELVRALLTTVDQIQAFLVRLAGNAALCTAIENASALVEIPNRNTNLAAMLITAVNVIKTANPIAVANDQAAGINVNAIMDHIATEFIKATITLRDVVLAGAGVATPFAPAVTTRGLLAPQLIAIAPARGQVLIDAAIALIDGGGYIGTAAASCMPAMPGPVAPAAAGAYVLAAVAAGINVRASVRDCVIEAVIYKLCNGPQSVNTRVTQKFNSFKNRMLQLIQLLPSSNLAATDAQKGINDTLKNAIIVAGNMQTNDDASADRMVVALYNATDAYAAGAGAAAAVAVIPLAAGGWAARNGNDMLRAFAYVFTRFVEMMQRRGITGLALAIANHATFLHASVNAAFDTIGFALRQEFVDSRPDGAATAVGAIAPNTGIAAVGAAIPARWARDVALPVFNEGPRFPELARTAARAGTASLTWLGPEVPADDDLSGPKRTHEYEAIHKVQLAGGPTAKQRLESVGIARFNTHFVRDMFFISNVNRLVRLKLNRELTHSRSVLRASHLAVASEVLEYNMDPFGPNAVFESRTRGTYSAEDGAISGEARYNDSDARTRTTM